MRLRGIRSFGPTLWGIALFLVVLAGTAPWIPVFLLTVLIQLLIFSTLAYSLNLITGLTGYVSFGHVVFMAFGAYALAFAVGTFHLHPVAVRKSGIRPPWLAARSSPYARRSGWSLRLRRRPGPLSQWLDPSSPFPSS